MNREPTPSSQQAYHSFAYYPIGNLVGLWGLEEPVVWLPCWSLQSNTGVHIWIATLGFNSLFFLLGTDGQILMSLELH